MSRGRICVLYGTRPEAIKVAPVVAELRAIGVEPTIICTGQHSDLLAGTPARQDLGGSCSLKLRSGGDVAEWIAQAVPEIQEALEVFKPISALVVQGDTMSAYAGALAAQRAGVPVAHVEAGIRSHSDAEPWPEEGIRKAIAQKADWHFAPTERARENLLSEGIAEDVIHVTGNTVVSAIDRYAGVTPVESPDQQILVTMHRREWVQMGRDFVGLTIDALYAMAEEYPEIRFLWPMHPNVVTVSGVQPTKSPANVLISPPLAYREAMAQLVRSIGVATDSGGLQEEAATLGVPCAVLRNVTDRPESEEIGVAKRFPPSADGMIRGIRCLLNGDLPRMPVTVYGDARSAARIAQFLHLLT